MTAPARVVRGVSRGVLHSAVRFGVACAVLLALHPGAGSASADQALTDTRALRAALQPHHYPYLVHVWATWCQPCVAEWPAVATLLQPYANDRVEVALLAIDHPEDAARGRQLLASGPAFRAKVLFAPGPVAYAPIRTLDPQWDGSIPLTLVWDGQGKQVLAQRGLTRLDELARTLAGVARQRDGSHHGAGTTQQHRKGDPRR